MREILWNLFVETGSIDAYLDYKNFMAFGFIPDAYTEAKDGDN